MTEQPQMSPVEAKCIFCQATVANGFDVVTENDELIAFRDRSPAAHHHLLIITRKHIESVKALTKDDVPLVESMKAFGDEALTLLKAPLDNESRRFGFHIPPLNSVNHIHLHCFGLPFRTPFHAMKYPIARRLGDHSKKGFSWFVEVGQVLSILESGGRVGILPERGASKS